MPKPDLSKAEINAMCSFPVPEMKLTATNLEIGINYLLGAKVDESGEIAVPARIFSDFVKNLEGDKLNLITKNNSLNINTDKYKIAEKIIKSLIFLNK